MKMRIIIANISKWLLGAAVLAAAVATHAETASTYQSPEAFLAEVFPGGTPPAKGLWLRASLRSDVSRTLGRTPPPRIRYWQQDNTTAWILDEVGKDLPITAGIVVRDGRIEDIRVLVFRESRGWEVKYPFFTRQFHRAGLDEDGSLDRHIDGITGATLSVRAMTRMARTALLLEPHTRPEATQLARHP